MIIASPSVRTAQSCSDQGMSSLSSRQTPGPGYPQGIVHGSLCPAPLLEFERGPLHFPPEQGPTAKTANLGDPWGGLSSGQHPVDVFVAKRAESPLRLSTHILLSPLSATVGLGHWSALAPAQGEARGHLVEKVVNKSQVQSNCKRLPCPWVWHGWPNEEGIHLALRAPRVPPSFYSLLVT